MENSIENLVATLEQQNEVKKDYLVKPANMMFAEGKLILTANEAPVIYTPSETFHQQVSDYTSIPKAYYDRMKTDAITLLDSNVNHWLKKTSKTKFVRTFENGDNVARAFLSDNYNVIDNYEVLFEALAAIKQTGLNIKIVAAELSDTRMYLKVTCPDVEIRATELLKRYARARSVGDGVVSGFVLQNSEVGKGSFCISPRAVVLACNNGLVLTKDNLKRVHLGSKMDDDFFAGNNSVRIANIRLIKEQLKHAVKVFLSPSYVEKLINVYTQLGEKEIDAPIAGVVEVVGKNYNLSQDRKASILNYFVKGGDSRRIGMVHAITEELQELTDADQRHDSEVMAMEVLQTFDRIESAAFKIKFSGS